VRAGGRPSGNSTSCSASTGWNRHSSLGAGASALPSVLGAVDIHRAARERQIAARDRFRAALGRWQQVISP
jgi:hypothetical protein